MKPPHIDRLLDAHLVETGYVDEKHIAARLEELEKAFRAGDLIAGLIAVEIAATAHTALPRGAIGVWLANGLALYRSGRSKSLDAALGLKAPGKKYAKFAHDQPLKLQAALSRMIYLHSIGAKIDQAALLVSRLTPDFARSTLSDRYARSGYGAIARDIRKQLIFDAAAVERSLAEYPDTPDEVKKIKAAIRFLYAKA